MSLQLQKLSVEFNILVAEYTETYQKYISSLESNTFVTVPNFSFIGQNNMNVLSNSDLSACESSCSSSSTCEGANFINSQNTCTLMSGTGNIIPTSQSTAIVQEFVYYSYQLKQINDRLIDINKQMMNIYKNQYKQYQQTSQQATTQDTLLVNNYETLLQERKQIGNLIKEYETLDVSYDNSSSIVNSNYFIYTLLLFITLFLVFVFIKLASSSNGK